MRERQNQRQRTKERRVEVGGKRMNENEGIIRRKRKKPIERAGGKEAGG
jgi:hypothetical protein